MVQHAATGDPATHGVQRLPACEFGQVEWEPRPTLFVALGGAATHVVRHLDSAWPSDSRRRKQCPLGQCSRSTPIRRQLPSAAAETTTANPEAADDTLLVPLRTTQDYRVEVAASAQLAQPPLAVQYSPRAANLGLSPARPTGLDGPWCRG